MESKQCMPDEIRASWLLTSARLIRRWVVRAWIFCYAFVYCLI